MVMDVHYYNDGLLEVSWTDMKSNIHVLNYSNQVYEKTILLSIIKEKKGKMCGHLLRYNPFVINIFEDQINGHKGKGRPTRKTYLKVMTRQASCKLYADMYKYVYKIGYKQERIENQICNDKARPLIEKKKI